MSAVPEEIPAVSPLFQLRNVRLNGTASARLQELSLSIPPGITAIMGASGAGKTSLLNLLAGYETPDAGEIRRFEPTARQQLTGGRPPNERPSGRLPLYWAPQTGGLWPHLSPLEHLSAVWPPLSADENPENQGRSWNSPGELLQAFGLKSRGNARIHELSQGERARLTVARAIATGAAVLLLDEPLAHVDALLTGTCWGVLSEFTRGTSTSVVLTTHETDVVMREADFMIGLRDGRIFCEGNPRDLYRHPPDQATALLFGAINWWTRAEARVWLPDAPENSPPCEFTALRPAQVRLIPQADSVLEAHRSRWCGDHVETTIYHHSTGQHCTVVHSPLDRVLSHGERIRIQQTC